MRLLGPKTILYKAFGLLIPRVFAYKKPENRQPKPPVESPNDREKLRLGLFFGRGGMAYDLP